MIFWRFFDFQILPEFYIFGKILIQNAEGFRK